MTTFLFLSLLLCIGVLAGLYWLWHVGALTIDEARANDAMAALVARWRR